MIYLVMFRNDQGHMVSVGGGAEFTSERKARTKAKEKRKELKATIYIMSLLVKVTK